MNAYSLGVNAARGAGWKVRLRTTAERRNGPRRACNNEIVWPLHNITIAIIVWCKAYTRRVGGRAYRTQ